jgi:ankyrin repeat protein
MMFWKKLFRRETRAKIAVVEEKESQTTTEPSPLPKICLAIMDGDLKQVEALLKDDPSLISFKNAKGDTPLDWAVMYDKKDIAELLFSKGSGVVSLAGAQSKAMAELLLAHKAEVNFINKGGWTPLLSAATSGRKEVVELLLANKAEVNVKNADGWTSLHLAAYYNYPDVVKLLLASGAGVNAIGNDGQTPLHATLNYKGKNEMVELLLANGAEVNVKDKDGKTPLHLAASKGKMDVVELLLANKADVNARDGRGKTPLQFAMISAEEDIARLLRQHGGQEFKPPMITEITLPLELIKAAESLEQRVRLLKVPARKVPLAEWNLVPQNIHDLIPNWIPTLLANFNLHGAVLEFQNNSENATWPRYFYIWGPAEYARNLSGKSRYCFADEFIADGLVMISDESDGDVWLTSISGGPSSPIYLFNVSGHEKSIASSRIDLLMSSMTVSK